MQHVFSVIAQSSSSDAQMEAASRCRSDATLNKTARMGRMKLSVVCLHQNKVKAKYIFEKLKL